MKKAKAGFIWSYWNYGVFLVLCLIFHPVLPAQNLIIENVSGFNGPVYPLYDSGELKGYYFFYKTGMYDKTFFYQLKILDKDLVETGNCKFEEDRELLITGSGSAGGKILLELTGYDKPTWKDLFINIPSKQVYHFLLDYSGNFLYADSSYYPTIKDLKRSGLVMGMPFYSPGVFELQHSGLAFTIQKRNSGKHYNYSIQFFINGNAKRSWQYYSDENYSDFNPYLIAGDSNLVYSIFSRIQSKSNKPAIFLQAFELRNGKKIFEKALTYKNNGLIPLKAFIAGEKIEIVCRINSGSAGDYSNLYLATLNFKGDLICVDILSEQDLNSIPGMPADGKTYIRTMVRKQDGNFVLIAEHSPDNLNAGGFFNTITGSNGQHEALTQPNFDGIILINCNSALVPYKIDFLYRQPSGSCQFIGDPVYNHFGSGIEMNFIYYEYRDRTKTTTFLNLKYDTTIASAKRIFETPGGWKTDFYKGKKNYLLRSSFNATTKMLHLTLIPAIQ